MDKPHAQFIRCLEDLKRAGVPIEKYFRSYQTLLANCETFLKCEDEFDKIVKEIAPKVERLKELSPSLKTLSSTIATHAKAQDTGFESFKKDCRENRWKVTEKDWTNMNVALNQIDGCFALTNKTYKKWL